MLRMLRGKNVVVKRALIEINIRCIGFHAEKSFCKLQHIVGVTRFGAFAVGDIAQVIVGSGKMLATAVSAY